MAIVIIKIKISDHVIIHIQYSVIFVSVKGSFLELDLLSTFFMQSSASSKVVCALINSSFFISSSKLFKIFLHVFNFG